MKTLTFGLFALLVAQNAQASLAGTLNLSCKLQYSSPTDFKATIKGPTKTGIYTMNFVEGYYGFEFKNKYSLKKVSVIELSSSKANVKELNVINGKMLIEVKTDKAGPVTLICQ